MDNVYKIKYVQFDNGTELISKIDFHDWEKTNYIKLYDPFRLYSMPPYLNAPEDSLGHQSLLLIKWLPWVDDEYISVATDKILIITDVAAHMQTHYNSFLQKYDKSNIKEEFDKAIDATSKLPTIQDLQEIGDLEEEILNSAPTSLEELTELLNNLVNSKTKKVLH